MYQSLVSKKNLTTTPQQLEIRECVNVALGMGIEMNLERRFIKI